MKVAKLIVAFLCGLLLCSCGTSGPSPCCKTDINKSAVHQKVVSYSKNVASYNKT